MAEVLGRYSKAGRVADRITWLRAAVTRSGPRPDSEPEWRPRALSRRLSADQLERMREEYRQGEGCTVLARRYGVSENALLTQLKRTGVVLREPGRKVTVENVIEMQRLREQGWTYQAIADRFGITRVAVSQRLIAKRR